MGKGALTSYRIVAATMVAAAVLLACAEIRNPEGGPPDKTPPKLVSSFPESGATAVAGEPKIRIKFTEAVQAGTGAQVFLASSVVAALAEQAFAAALHGYHPYGQSI